jgi:hypothetical protein
MTLGQWMDKPAVQSAIGSQDRLRTHTINHA